MLTLATLPAVVMSIVYGIVRKLGGVSEGVCMWGLGIPSLTEFTGRCLKERTLV